MHTVVSMKGKDVCSCKWWHCRWP